MKSGWFLIGLGCLLVGAAGLWFGTPLLKSRLPGTGPWAKGKEEGRPNVVLISVDTTRPDHLGCYGYRRNTSPHIDQLAREGIRFSRAYSQASWTLPSHMALLTSLLPSHNGVEHSDRVLPAQIPTLAEILRSHGYKTAALVNNGQMQAHWGFHRGFDLWREFDAETPQGNCDHITAAALTWFAAGPAEPFFLFLHYFDPHDPYNPPAPFREAFGSSLTGMQAHRLLEGKQFGNTRVDDPDLMRQLIGSYDGEIAWVDQELGKLFACLPGNTLVVLFSDHGEAFKEHGWMQHGATLYEEEIHTALILRHPRLLPGPRVLEDPVMLLDVAPTILSLCAIPAPPHFEGMDLSPLLEGKPLPERLILAETKWTLDGRLLKMGMLNNWKLISSLVDGKRELYQLPDEHTDRARQDAAMARTLLDLLRPWIAEENYWIVYAKGKGQFEATVTPRPGQFSKTIPIGTDEERDRLDIGPDGRWYHWTCELHGDTKAMYLQFAPKDAAIRFEFRIDGVERPEQVYLGERRVHPKQFPVELTLEDSASDPVMKKRFEPDKDGFYVMRYRSKAAASFPAQPAALDEKTIRQLRSLGYLR